MNILPLEILDIIASNGGYHGLLCIQIFADSLTPSRRVDFMIELGYNVEITRRRITWKHNGRIHRFGGPAVETIYGDKEWWVGGKLHRTDGPALDYSHGQCEWFINGKYHRDGGPAVKYSNGSTRWWVNGKRHRTDGPAIEDCDGTKEWWVDGIRTK